MQAAAKESRKCRDTLPASARSFVDMSNYKMAVKFFDQALAKDTTKANWIYETGLTYFAIPDAKRAIDILNWRWQKATSHNDVMENLIQCIYRGRSAAAWHRADEEIAGEEAR